MRGEMILENPVHAEKAPSPASADLSRPGTTKEEALEIRAGTGRATPGGSAEVREPASGFAWCELQVLCCRIHLQGPGRREYGHSKIHLKDTDC